MIDYDNCAYVNNDDDAAYLLTTIICKCYVFLRVKNEKYSQEWSVIPKENQQLLVTIHISEKNDSTRTGKR